MDESERAWVTERLVCEFADVPSRDVFEAVCTCADECASVGAFFVEQAVRARLRSVSAADDGPPGLSSPAA